MSLFQCQHCGCCENTALSSQGFLNLGNLFDWSYAPEREGMLLCSACGPLHYKNGQPTGSAGKWHDYFPRVFLRLGDFRTAENGNLEHIQTGEQDYQTHALKRIKYPVERPVPGRQVHVWDGSEKYLGLGMGVESALCGVVIWLDTHNRIDSNKVVYWSYHS